MLGLFLLFLTAYALLALIGTVVIVLMIVRPRRKSYAYAVAHGLPTDLDDLGLIGEEATFNLPGQHSTPGWLIKGEKPDGPTVLVLHGHRDFTHGAMRFVETLAPFAGHIVLFDWPGHGGCTAPWMTCGKREPDDAIAVLDGLPDAIRDRPVVLFGYSLGGQIAVKTAGLHPDRFAGLIIDGAYRRWDTPIRLKLKRYRVPSFPFIQLTWLVFWLGNLIRQFDRVQYAKRYPGPVLVLHGTDDRICPIDEGKDLADAAPNSAFIPIEGGRHNQLHEQEPERYADALENHFNVLPSSPPGRGPG
ncbi:MAG: alpha/beta hydrolase [Phycisphaeraceae bacterium]|nr:alpha/beta hydrolase [Phycisphaeraceae bacterium]